MSNIITSGQIRTLYERFDAPITAFDCGKMCAPYNPSGKPFCCDICQAVPAVYKQEWLYLQENTDLWHVWRGDECQSDSGIPQTLRAETPDSMLLLACKGPEHCQRQFRALSCRQFPFFPYVASDYRFSGLAVEWEFESTCWVISHLEAVTATFRQEFIDVWGEIFRDWQEELDSYLIKSEEMRAHYAARKRRFPLLHRNGGYYLVSPESERMEKVRAESLRRFGPYR